MICDWTETGIVEVAAFESLARPSGDEHRLPGAAGALKFNGLTVEQIDKAPLDWQVGQALEAFIVNHGVAAIGAFNDPSTLIRCCSAPFAGWRGCFGRRRISRI